LADEMQKIQISEGDPAEDWMQFRATLMGASYGIVSPYLPMPYALTRGGYLPSTSWTGTWGRHQPRAEARALSYSPRCPASELGLDVAKEVE